MSNKIEDKPSEAGEWWVYMIHTKKDRLYTGITTDVERRLRQHKGEIKGGAKFFNGDQALAVVYRECCANRSDASKREAQIKKMTKSAKRDMVISAGSER